MVFAWILFLGTVLLNKTVFKPSSKPLYFAPPTLIKYFSFGFAEVYADLLWLRLIQDIDFCELKKGRPNYEEKKQFQCEEGWSYKMADAITELAPRFLKPHEISPLILSVVMGDKIGAQKIFDKGVKRFPHHWSIHFYSGYHELLEMKNRRKAYDRLLVAAQEGGPSWLYSLVSKGYSEMNEWVLARKVLKDLLKKDKVANRKIKTGVVNKTHRAIVVLFL